MNEKTEFARVVPAMFQERAYEWLQGKIDDDLEALAMAASSGTDISKYVYGVEKNSAFRSRIIKSALIHLYSDDK